MSRSTSGSRATVRRAASRRRASAASSCSTAFATTVASTAGCGRRWRHDGRGGEQDGRNRGAGCARRGRRLRALRPHRAHPLRELHRWLEAFRRDAVGETRRFATWADVLEYCRRSANPVGQLVLALFGHRDAARRERSDDICTALQLTNFWQDVAGDLDRGRVYLPEEDLARCPGSHEALATRRVNAGFRDLLAFEVPRTRALFERGLPLADMVGRRLRHEVRIFARGGLAILARIEAAGYDVFAGRRRHPVGVALADTVERFAIAREHFEAVITGVETDLRRDRYETWEGDLAEYCHRVASSVGLIAIEIFGYQNPSARQYAVHLGLAFQLTNILRDVAEDARRGRIYLPREDLRRFDCREDDVLAGRCTEAFQGVMAFECARAGEHYGRARFLLAEEDRPALAPAEAMRLIYEQLLRRVMFRHYDVFGPKVRLTRPEKAALA